jgi:hypothetical protein
VFLLVASVFNVNVEAGLALGKRELGENKRL